jgi:Asp-tRNA(Asn)/Glu-tRNA(Gln) amidotransferase A subunit family amidase
MVPLALGTQTNGSVISPASYCGVYGYKPTIGRISQHLVLRQSRPLDQIGVFARSIEDAALIAQQIIDFDERDPDTCLRARPDLLKTLAGETPGRTAPGTCQNPGVKSGRSEFQRICALDHHCRESGLPAVRFL